MQDSQKNVYNKNLGASGEKKAAKYLKKLKYKILEKNYFTPFGEADIVARDGEDIVFIEVKTRTSELFGEPSEAVNKNKRRRYRNIAAYYLSDAENSFYRFDVIEVIGEEINHIKNAF